MVLVSVQSGERKSLEATHMMKFADPSGAKAQGFTGALMYGLKPVPSKTVLAGFKSQIILSDILARDPLCGFPESCPDTRPACLSLSSHSMNSSIDKWLIYEWAEYLIA
jgi:hypothetical protein